MKARCTLFFLALTLLGTTGCFSLIVRKQALGHVEGLYCPTVAEAAGINSLWLAEDYRKSSYALSVPLLIDLPFTAVLDTLCLPYDYYYTNKHKEEDEEDEQ